MTAAARTVPQAYPLIVHSHLRWDFVWQRPQQILSRFGRSRVVLYVEEPVFSDDVAGGLLDVSQPSPGVYRVVPRLHTDLAGSYDVAAARVRMLLVDLVGEGGELAGRFNDAVQWFYTPMPARAMLGAFGESAVVYDCMDELAQFRFAPPDLASRERDLMSCADIVFTGGYRLYESKARQHANVHFFGCGVDADHFGLARHSDTPVPSELVGAPGPVLGYFGVVDERIDYELIARLADTFPNGTLALVGPLAKVDQRELPQRSNILWLGQRAYSVLPHYVKGFDVCLMPFALNEATEFINPTKTLEYMAAGKPVVSTAVPDVVRNFGTLVRVADSIDAFVRETQAALTPDRRRIEQGVARAEASSWESIVAAMDRFVFNAVRMRNAPFVDLASISARRLVEAVGSGRAANGSASAGVIGTNTSGSSVANATSSTLSKRSNPHTEKATTSR
jgi:glycosyltransferase involved in cell wall biosynthesis